jgi:adenylyl-sulfate kinase
MADSRDVSNPIDRSAVTVWLTGVPGAGKTTLARRLRRALREAGRAVSILDGDEVRKGLCAGLGFSQADRDENVRRVAETAKILNDAGVYTVCALVSPTQAQRDNARSIVGTGRFICVYLNPPQSVCEKRDPKGMYREARTGARPGFTGVGAPYEVPRAPDLVIDTSTLSEAKATEAILATLEPWRRVRHVPGRPKSGIAGTDLWHGSALAGVLPMSPSGH